MATINNSLRLSALVMAIMAGAFVVAAGLPDAQAQATPPQCSPDTSNGQVCIDKTVSSNPVQVSQSVTFTIDLTYSSPLDLATDATVTDVLPPGVEFQSADGDCTQQSQNVVCDVFLSPRLPSSINIEVIASECGTFANTATVETNTGGTSADTEDFTVEGCTAPPVAQKDTYAIEQGKKSLSVPAPVGVLANDTDPDEDALTVSLVRGPSVGTLKLREDGSFTYKMPKRTFERNEFNGVTFVYEVSDGQGGTDTAKATINKE